MISLSMRSSSALRTGAPERPYIMRQIPDVLVGFDPSKRGHPAQTNSIFYNPEQFAIGVLLHRRRCEIRGARIHPPPGVSGCMAIGAMTHCAFGAVELVPFLDARLQIRWCWGNNLAAAPTDEAGFCLCRETGCEMAGLLKRVELYLSESHDHSHRSKGEGNKYNENPALHPISPAREAIRKAREGRLSARPSPTGYDAALIAATWIVLVALSKVPVTSTFRPANGSGFFWSSSWENVLSALNRT